MTELSSLENVTPMHESLQTEHYAEQVPQLSLFQRFQQKLAESRYFMLSCVIHAVIVILGGSIVIYKTLVDPPDFIAEGGEGLISATDDLAPPPETPAEAVPTEQVTPQAPNINSPNIDVISTTAQSSNFKVAPTQVQVKINTNANDLAKATNSNMAKVGAGLGKLPGTMGGRTGTGRAKAMEQNKMKSKSEMRTSAPPKTRLVCAR